jgi:hypothetical protein
MPRAEEESLRESVPLGELGRVDLESSEVAINQLPPMPTPHHWERLSESTLGCVVVLLLIGLFVGLTHGVAVGSDPSGVLWVPLALIYVEVRRAPCGRLWRWRRSGGVPDSRERTSGPGAAGRTQVDAGGASTGLCGEPPVDWGRPRCECASYAPDRTSPSLPLPSPRRLRRLRSPSSPCAGCSSGTRATSSARLRRATPFRER